MTMAGNSDLAPIGRLTKTGASAGKKASRRSGPGRPEGLSKLRDEILDAAEAIFADLGYAGTTLREVADRARVTQALINYYFGSKYGVFEEVFLRRGRKISDERLEGLTALRSSGAPLTVAAIVRAFLTPTLAMRATVEGRAFLRLQARLHTEPPEISYKIRNEAYDHSTREFASAFGEALPSLSGKEIYWRLTLIIGAYMYAVSDTHRLDELAPELCDPNDADEVLAMISAFATAGMSAPP
jgi:AcrR family transcriptional regulator